MADLYFDKTNEDIVGDWIKDIDPNPLSNAQAPHVPLSGMTGDARNNFGLGFDSKTKASSKTDDRNALIESIKKKKAKAKALSNKDMNYELHGVVDDMEEVSRTSIVPSKTKPKPPEAPTTTAVAVPINSAPVVENTSKDTPPIKNTTKRPKTRSKQKNIRRDKRAPEHKPSHLRVGSKEYRGRPITPATKQLLGIEQKPSIPKRPHKKAKYTHESDMKS